MWIHRFSRFFRPLLFVTRHRLCCEKINLLNTLVSRTFSGNLRTYLVVCELSPSPSHLPTSVHIIVISLCTYSFYLIFILNGECEAWYTVTGIAWFPLLQNLTMHRISSAKACFLSKFDEVMPNPSDLVNILDQVIQVRLFFMLIFAFPGVEFNFNFWFLISFPFCTVLNCFGKSFVNRSIYAK